MQHLSVEQRELEILAKHLARAKPPPILYRYRKPNEWTLDEIGKHHIFAAAPDDLNDPFEYSAPVHIDVPAFRKRFIEEFCAARGIPRKAAAEEFDSHGGNDLCEYFTRGMAELRADSGIICLTAVPNSIRMWSYYAQAHEGVCLGYNTRAGPFLAAMKVIYQNPDKPVDLARVLADDPAQLAEHISLRKAAEWEFEQEYRIPVGPIQGRPRAMPYHPSALVEVRFGARLKEDYRAKIFSVISQLQYRPRLIQMSCDRTRFVLTEREVSSRIC